MNHFQSGKISFADFGGHLLLNLLEYEEFSSPREPIGKPRREKERKAVSRRLSPDLPMT